MRACDRAWPSLRAPRSVRAVATRPRPAPRRRSVSPRAIVLVEQRQPTALERAARSLRRRRPAQRRAHVDEVRGAQDRAQILVAVQQRPADGVHRRAREHRGQVRPRGCRRAPSEPCRRSRARSRTAGRGRAPGCRPARSASSRPRRRAPRGARRRTRRSASPRPPASRRATASRNIDAHQRLQVVLGVDDVAKRRVVHASVTIACAWPSALLPMARACSMATGLRFCGMMLLDCTKPSPKRT